MEPVMNRTGRWVSVGLGRPWLIVIGMGVLFLVGYRLESPNPWVWNPAADANEPRARHENGYVEVNGKFYLIGGRGTRRVEIYDPTSSTWTAGPQAPDDMSLHHFQAVALRDTIFVVGAYTETFPDEIAVDHIYQYDTVHDQWAIGPEIPVAYQRGSAAVAVYNDKLYIVGGSIGGHSQSAVRLTSFLEYDPLTNTWVELPDAPHARDHVQAAVVGAKLYVAGGRNGNQSNSVEEVDIYNFLTGQWTTLPSPSEDLPTPRSGATTLAVGAYVLVIGGESNQQLAHKETELLDTATNTWYSLDPLVVGRHGTQAVYFNNNIYIAAGSAEKGGGPELASQEVLWAMGEPNLPVELAPGFEAVVDGDAVALRWRTLSETNNAGFEVQRRQGSRFESIGWVEGAGTSIAPHDYRFEVENLPPGRHVFRLKQIDFNGRFEFSPEASALISIAGGFHLGDIYPNPTNPQARFSLTLTREQYVRIDVYDLLGRRMARIFDGSLASEEPQIFTIQSDAWAGGKYVLRVDGEYFSATRFFTVIK